MDRGPWPNSHDSLPVQFVDYSDAQHHLVDRLGWFCSYCEMPILNQPAVEHIQPKSHRPDLERTWCNLLLACASCNSTKGTTRSGADECLFPDAHNTALAFAYSEAGVHVSTTLSPDVARRATRMWRLVGLDKRHGGERAPGRGDQRSIRRFQAWGEAVTARQDLLENRSPRLIRLIVALALAKGFWSVWMAVFADDQEMRGHFLQAFAGTARGCFDAETRPIRRTGGVL
ncbi:MAG: HNH endonuclease [Byssovorax sp.]